MPTDNKPWKRLTGRIKNDDVQTILAVNGTNVFDNGPDTCRLDNWAPSVPLNQSKQLRDG
ncbi:MAG: hypothetical protein OXC02_10485 [Rhodobacteraceae bacterium]|nr:hypothetical protein [Paracoccaceae bacterium]